MQALERRAAEVQAAVETSWAYWLEMADVLAAQRRARPAHVRVVRRSQCLHHKRRRLTAKDWQPCVYDPDTRPACASMIRGVVSPGPDCRTLFSDITVGASVLARGSCCPCSPSSRERASREAVQ